MRIDDETLFAFVDGTLPPDEQQRVALAIADDPALAERVERHERLAKVARESFSGDLAEPIPDAWIARIDGALPQGGVTGVASLAAARERRRARWTTWQAGGAVAAALVVGLFIGRGAGEGSGLIAEHGGVLLASAEVGRALDQARSGVPVDLDGAGRSINVQLSLRTTNAFCREAVVAGDEGANRLVACRGDEGWRIAGLAPDGRGNGGYQTVGGETALEDVLDSLGGEPLDAAGEQDAIRRGWRR